MSAPGRQTMRRGWCPGTLRPMATGDGLLVRLHPPRNVLMPDQLDLIADLAQRHGNGQVEVSGRGHLQVRGIRDEAHPALVEALLAAGLVDEAEGDGPNRLVLPSPLAGRAADEFLDAASLADAVERIGRSVSGLPAKLSVVVDGGGALALDHVAADLRLRAISAETLALGLPDNLWFGPIACGEAAAIVARLLDQFAERRRSAEGLARMRDLGADALSALAAMSGLAAMAAPAKRAPPRGVGVVAERDGRNALLAVLPFGRTDARGLARIADLARKAGSDGIRPTPWRGLAVCGLANDCVAPLREALRIEGLVVAAGDPRLSIAACTGAPACARGAAPTLADAAMLADRLAPLLAGGLGLHVSGCAKSCAHPSRADLTLVGRDGRYDVVVDGASGDAAIAHLSATELVHRLEPGQDVRARLDALGHQKQVLRA